MKIVIGDLSAADGAQTLAVLQDMGAETVFLDGNIADESFSKALASAALDRWGSIDVLVANAANRNFTPLQHATGQEWDEMLGVNLKGTAFSCKAVLPQMIAQHAGAIVLMSSVHHQVGRSAMPLYDATKAGIVSLTKSLAVDHASDGIRANAVCPGFTVTDFHIRKAVAEGRSVEELERSKVGLLQRPADPSEIAAAAYFLASDEASFITGQALMVDGGLSVG